MRESKLNPPPIKVVVKEKPQVVAKPKPVKEPKVEPPDPRELSLKLWDKLGIQYKKTYEKNGRTVADRDLMLDLRENQRLLIDGGIYTAKELDDRIQDLQKEIDSSGSDGTASMEDIFCRWLNGPTEAVQ